jgi:GNAT superfamily N-acetyltransferase
MASEGLFSVSEMLSVQDQTELDDLLDNHNIAHTGIRDGRSMSIMLRAEDGELYAGLHGFTWGGCCVIKTLWVAESHRGHGLGGRLLDAAGDEAAKRGCVQVVLSTHSFQAPQFYQRHGYRPVATINDYPVGHSEIMMVKRLAD